MEQAIRKAEVLIEALPYIKAYSSKIFVIKYGGSALICPDIEKRVLQDIVFMSYVGIRPILIHGGGPFINEELRKLNRKVTFKDGLRVTTKEDMDVVDRVLTELNQRLVHEIKKLGARAVSLNTDKKNIIKVVPHKDTENLGFVGEVQDIDIYIIKKSARIRAVPVLSPIGIGKNNELYNVNADDVSAEIASNLKAVKLVLLTDVKGIMREKGNEGSLISSLTVQDADSLIKNNIIQGGMIPKVKACMKALESGVLKTHIIDARIPYSLLLEIFTDKGIGTEIVKG